MCGPANDSSVNGPTAVGSASPVLGVISDVLGFVGAKQQWSANKRVANQNYFDRVSALETQRSELDASDAERAVDEAIASVQEGGRIAVVGGEFLGAASQARLRNTAAQEASRSEAIGDLNSQNQRRQIGREKSGAEVERISALNRVAKPSLGALAIKVAGRGVDATTGIAKVKGG